MGRFWALAFVLLSLPFAGRSFATTMIPLDLPGLTTRADFVVSGHVATKQSTWTPSHDAIYTEIDLNVERVLSGAINVGDSLVIRTEGGVVGEQGMMVHGAAGFAVGEEVVVFVQKRNGANYVVGMAQGKLTVTADSAGVKRVHRNLTDVGFSRTPTQAERTLGAQGSSVDELERAVRSIQSTSGRSTTGQK